MVELQTEQSLQNSENHEDVLDFFTNSMNIY